MKKGGGKRKGDSFERSVAKVLSAIIWGQDGSFVRSPGSGGWGKLSHMTDHSLYGKTVGDIVCPDEFPFIVSCKNVQAPNLDMPFFFLKFGRREVKGDQDFFAWWEEVCCEAENAGKLPMLVYTKNRWPTICCINRIPEVRKNPGRPFFEYSMYSALHSKQYDLLFFLLDSLPFIIGDRPVLEKINRRISIPGLLGKAKEG